MIDLRELESYLAELLDTASYDDYCVNGLQVEGSSEIGSIVTGVTASERLFKAAVDKEADAVLVHHGLFWRNSPHPISITGIWRKRIKLLLENDISLFGYHLPLDGHPTLGNNALIAQALGLSVASMASIDNTKPPIACVCELGEAMPFEQFQAYADLKLSVDGIGLELTGKPVRRVFVLSGGGSGYYRDAAQASCDTLLTGELREDSVRAAEEMGLNLYAAGHYNSEKWGIRALGEQLTEKFGISSEFIDIPNPI